MNLFKKLLNKKNKKLELENLLDKNSDNLNKAIKANPKLKKLHDKNIQYSPISGTMYYNDSEGMIIIGMFNNGIQIYSEYFNE